VYQDDHGFTCELDYDPLDDAGVAKLDEEDQDIEFIGLVGSQKRLEAECGDEPGRSSEQRINDLLSSLPAQKKILLALIDFCRSARSPQEVDEFTQAMQKTNRSVYTPVMLRQLLEEAGALIYQQDEQANEETVAVEPLTQQDGSETEYLVVQTSAQGNWLSTPEALVLYDALDPLSNLKTILGQDNEYLEIYRRILEFCADEPRSKIELNVLVDDDPLLQQPRRYSGYFIDRLNEYDALAWMPLWKTTDIGLKVLVECALSEGEAEQ
jgi:hypothetical protein